MTTIPDPLLAVDVETATPNDEPGREDYQNTGDYEPVAVGLGHQSRPGVDVETAVLFRGGGWEPEATNDRPCRTDEWCADRDADGVLTYEGEGERFDEVHLKGWARWLAREGVWPEGPDRFDALFSNRIDLSRPAVARYRDRLGSSRERISLEDVGE